MVEGLVVLGETGPSHCALAPISDDRHNGTGGTGKLFHICLNIGAGQESHCSLQIVFCMMMHAVGNELSSRTQAQKAGGCKGTTFPAGNAPPYRPKVEDTVAAVSAMRQRYHQVSNRVSDLDNQVAAESGVLCGACSRKDSRGYGCAPRARPRNHGHGRGSRVQAASAA